MRHISKNRGKEVQAQTCEASNKIFEELSLCKYQVADPSYPLCDQSVNHRQGLLETMSLHSVEYHHWMDT